MVIGKKGADIEKLRNDLAKMTGSEVSLNIVEIRKPEIDAKLVAENIAQQLERRVAFRRAMKRAVQSAMRLGAQGIRINCGGRLGGAEIARIEWYREGRVPLHTLRADVDFGTATAKTTYGTCGVKVWVFKGEILAHDPMAQDKRAQEQQASRAARPHDERLRTRSCFARNAPSTARRTRAASTAPPRAAPTLNFGAYGLKAIEPEPDHRAPDRGRAPRDHPPHPPRRPRLDPHLPGRAGVDEAGRGAHGQRQGRAGVLGLPGASPAASCSRSTACRRRSRARRSSWPPPSCRSRTRFVARLGEEAERDEGRRSSAPRRRRRADERARRSCSKEQFNLRFQRASGQLENTARVRQVRRDIARIKTVLGEQAPRGQS